VNILLFQCLASTKQNIKLKVSFNSIAMATVIICHKVPNPITANDHDTMAMVITHTFINIIVYGPQSLNSSK
jgi:hypothetical protein